MQDILEIPLQTGRRLTFFLDRMKNEKDKKQIPWQQFRSFYARDAYRILMLERPET
jgi:hypothetical protein